jgi:predicted DNA-binding protein with PD1-like motif
MNGLIVDGEPHIHLSLSTADGAFGGHLESGCKAYALCEIFFTEISAISYTRQRTALSVDGMGTGEISRLVSSESNHFGEQPKCYTK